MSIPRAEYPRPQFVREDWLCLNGPWAFEIDPSDSGVERGLKDRALRDRIVVPFCPESELSGVGHTDFMQAVWYRRQVPVPAAWRGRDVLLHFQAVDYDATVWVNGVEVGRHRGGWCGFTCELAGVVEPGDMATIVVRARDDMRELKPRGKQSAEYHNHACEYTRTTGIWQTVWLEPVPKTRLERPVVTPDVAGSCFHVEQPIRGPRDGVRLRVTLLAHGRTVATQTIHTDRDLCPRLTLPIPPEHRRLWSPDDPFLYDLTLELLDETGEVIDRAMSYAGLRSVTIEGAAVKLNGRAVFQRLVLDQGYYPDGIMTAPSDEALQRDITLAQEAGFNGARLHQKVFEERFLYHADRLGYLCWGEFGDWGIDKINPPATYLTQWLEVLQRDRSHPCLVGWCALNETWHVPITDRISGLEDLTRGTVLAARAIDPTRPVLDASGGAHLVPESDIYDSHDYEQDPAAFAEHYKNLARGKPRINGPADRPWSIPYRGQPFFVSEFGGTWWNPEQANDADSWGYGDRPRTVDEFHERFRGLCDALLDHPHMFGYCYTQLTDVFQEQNGVFFFDRRAKFDLARLRQVQQRPAAIEQADDETPSDAKAAPAVVVVPPRSRRGAPSGVGAASPGGAAESTDRR